MVLGYRIHHVQLERGLGVWPKGAKLGHGAQDVDIAAWCTTNDWVLVTTDDDFRAMYTRGQVYLHHGAEVIFCTPQPKSLQAQTELFVRRYPEWTATMEACRSGGRVWVQKPRSFKIEAGRPC